MATKICKIITPPSEGDSNLTTYEYMLVWYGRTGELLQHLFLDFEILGKVNTESINIKDSTNIGNLVISETEEIGLIGEDLTANEVETLRAALVTKNIYRLFKGGTSEKVSVTGRNFAYKNSAQRFNFELSVIRPENNLPQ